MRDQQDNKQDSKVDGSRKPGTFSKGDPRINRAGPPRKVDADPVAPQLLRDLRHVYNRAKSADKTQGQRMLRKLFEREPEKFVYRLQKAEAEFRAMPRPEAVEPEEEVDQGTANSLALLDNLLIQHEAERIAEDAAFAKRPDAAQIGATLQEKLSASLEREAMLRKQIDELRGQRHG